MNKLTVLLSIWKHCGGGGGEGGLARIDEKRSTGYSVLFFPRSAFVNESPSCRCLRAVFTSGLTSAPNSVKIALLPIHFLSVSVLQPPLQPRCSQLEQHRGETECICVCVRGLRLKQPLCSGVT